jgi:hypothetical protein
VIGRKDWGSTVRTERHRIRKGKKCGGMRRYIRRTAGYPHESGRKEGRAIRQRGGWGFGLWTKDFLEKQNTKEDKVEGTFFLD